MPHTTSRCANVHNGVIRSYSRAASHNSEPLLLMKVSFWIVDTTFQRRYRTEHSKADIDKIDAACHVGWDVVSRRWRQPGLCRRPTRPDAGPIRQSDRHHSHLRGGELRTGHAEVPVRFDAIEPQVDWPQHYHYRIVIEGDSSTELILQGAGPKWWLRAARLHPDPDGSRGRRSAVCDASPGFMSHNELGLMPLRGVIRP